MEQFFMHFLLHNFIDTTHKIIRAECFVDVTVFVLRRFPMKKNWLALLLKGFCVGGSMLVPGVSGGSMAIILGIYDNLIIAAGSLFKTPKKSIPYLSLFVLGGLLGFAAVANPLKHLIAWNEKLVMYFFIGAVVGSIPMMIQKAGIKRMELRSVLFFTAGLFIIWLTAQSPENMFATTKGFCGILTQAAGGFLSASALILPGISISYLLVVLGLYESILSAIASFNAIALLPFTVGLAIGIAVCIKILSHLLLRHPKPTYLVILGFIVGSVAEIFPGIPHTPSEWLLGILIFLAGFFPIMALSRQDSN